MSLARLVFLLLAACSLAAVGLGVSGEDDAKRVDFDIPSGKASETLQEAAVQADVQILFAAGIPKGVMTRSIRGEYTVREALDNMLSGTPLVAVPVSAGKAFGILRRATDENPRASLSDHQQKTRETTTRTNMKLSQTKKRKSLRNLISGLAALSVAQSSALNAQNEEDDIFELSPFLVEASENEGYRATTTLAGTRIKSNLADIGSAISVLTQEVFEDTGATNAETILPYSLNVEVAGVQGNFADVSPSGGQRLRSNSTARNGNSATRVRGLSPAIYARGLFQTDIPFDSYNTARVTINRGPNSLLFGATTPGGVIDQSLNKATLGKDSGSFEFRIGERSSKRFVFDANKILIKDRLALRVSLLEDETNYQQRPTYKKDRRLYADALAVLYKGSDDGILGRTSLRGNVEFGDISGVPPKITPPGDSLSGWFAPPSRSLEQFTGVTLPDNWVEGFVFKSTVDNRVGSVDELNQPFLISRPFFINMAMYYAQPDLQAPSMGIPGFPEVAGMPARTLWRSIEDYPFRQDTWATFPIFGRSDIAPGFTVPTINDRNVFDNQNLSAAGTVPYRNTEFEVQSVSLEQELFNGKGGIELAYDRQSFDNGYYDPFGGGTFQGNAFRGNEIRIDVSEYLTNGRPNPNLGRPFMVDFATPHFFNNRERESKRVTAFYELDFADKDGFLGKLGRHVFTGFFSEDSAEITSTSDRNKWINIPGSPFDIRQLVNDRLNGERRNVPLIVYLGDSLLDSDIQSVSDVRLTQFASFPAPLPGDRAINHFHSFFRSPINTTDPSAPLESETFEVYRTLNGGSIRRTENDAKSLGLQSFFFDGNLVGLIGWRDDSVKTIENITLANFLAATPDANADGLLDSGEFDRRRIRLSDESNPDHAGQISEVSDETVTWSLVGHLPENLLKLPGGSRLSVHYNESESFVPTRARRDFNGDEIPPESGSTKEYGFTFATRDGRLSARVNWFELEQANATASGGPGAPGMTGWLRFWKDAELNGIAFEDALMTGLDTRPNLTPNITSYEQMYDAIIGLLPQTQQDLFNIRFGPDGRTVLVDPNPGQAVTTNAVAEGFEIDLVGNINESWSVMLNYGKQETVTSDSAPVAGEFVTAVAQNIVSRGLDVVTFTPSLFEYFPMARSWNGNVNSLNALRGKDGTVSLEQRKERINLISTYSFLDDSRFKGVTVGGALRWQSAIATGYETEVDDGVVTPIVSRPFLGPEELNGDAWVSYERQLSLRDRPIDWKIQLNVRNLIGGDDYIPVVTNPDGTVAVVRNPPTKEFFLTNTFSF